MFPWTLLKKAEFTIYYLYLICLFIIYIPEVYEISKQLISVIGNRGAGKIQAGWLGHGLLMDMSDGQYTHFRTLLLPSMCIAILHVGLGRYLSKLCHKTWPSYKLSECRVIFHLCFSLIILTYIFGFDIIPLIGITLGNYGIGRICGKHWLGPWLTWLYCCGWMYHLAASPEYKWTEVFEAVGLQQLNLRWDDHLGYRRSWRFEYNLLCLRMISFNMDYYWLVSSSGHANLPGAVKRQHKASCVECLRGESCYWLREKNIAAFSIFRLSSYLAYLLYLPLFAAGPTSSFSAFISHLERPKQLPVKSLALYALRLVLSWLLLEVALHFFHVFFLLTNFGLSVLRLELSPDQVAVCIYGGLTAIWLKFYVIWRFYRLWALCDGVDVPENMPRCFSNNYTVTGFWKNWHSSFNRWLVRYIYIPLGGRSGGSSCAVLRRLFNVLVVFSFVAAWHSPSMQMLSWGWISAFSIAPELIASSLYTKLISRQAKCKSSEHRLELRYERHLISFGSVFNILFLVLANLIGYGLSRKVMDSGALLIHLFDSIPVLIGAAFALFSATQIMLKRQQAQAAAAVKHVLLSNTNNMSTVL